MNWRGVFAAITTPFREDLSIDEAFLATHVDRLVRAGCTGIVPLGSLGESATLEAGEKSRVIDVCVEAAAGRVPVVAGVAGLSTAAAVALGREAEVRGCSGLMLLPAWVYGGADWRETRAHFDALLDATGLPCMLYNNPVAYGTDVLPGQIAMLAEHPSLVAVKESSTDVRRVTALRALMGERLAVFVGVDDAIVEGIAAGAVGWIAGLVNALPEESVRLFDLATRGESREAQRLYQWFLPLLRLDTVPRFVQLIKLVQQEVGLGSERVRPPRLPLVDPDRAACLSVIRQALETRPGA